ncbi:MAG: single-stranded DNA-binding protein [bacterium]
MDLNKTMIIGRLTRDPEVRTTTSGKNVSSFSIATSYMWKDANGAQQEKTEFHNVVAWGKLGEICGQYLKKGKKTYIEGRLQTRDWVGQDGIKRYRTEIIADNMIMLDSKPMGESQNYPSQNTAAPAQIPTIQTESIANDQVTEEEIRVEDIPF